MALSYSEAKANFKKAQEELDAAIEAERANAIQQAKALVKEFGITASELGLKTRTRKSKTDDGEVSAPLEAKYANPANSGETWHGGRGAKPKWVKAYLEQGGKIEDLAIKK